MYTHMTPALDKWTPAVMMADSVAVPGTNTTYNRKEPRCSANVAYVKVLCIRTTDENCLLFRKRCGGK